MDRPHNVILLNRRCSPGCSVCPGEATLSLEEAMSALREAASRSPVVYLGIEAFAALDLLPALIAAAAEEGVLPILMTCGCPAQPLAVLEKAVTRLSASGPCAVLWALDPEHHERLDMREAKHLLRMVDRVTTATLQVLFVLPDGAVLPPSLLQTGLIHRGCMIATRRGDSLSGYIEASAGDLLDLVQDIATGGTVEQPPPSGRRPISGRGPRSSSAGGTGGAGGVGGMGGAGGVGGMGGA